MSRARLVTGDSTAAGPRENRVLQCGVESEERPGIASGLLFKTVLTGLVWSNRFTDSMAGCPAGVDPAVVGGVEFEFPIKRSRTVQVFRLTRKLTS